MDASMFVYECTVCIHRYVMLHTYMASFDSSQTPKAHSNDDSSNYEANHNPDQDYKDDDVFASGTIHWYDDCGVD